MTNPVGGLGGRGFNGWAGFPIYPDNRDDWWQERVGYDPNKCRACFDAGTAGEVSEKERSDGVESKWVTEDGSVMVQWRGESRPENTGKQLSTTLAFPLGENAILVRATQLEVWAAGGNAPSPAERIMRDFWGESISMALGGAFAKVAGFALGAAAQGVGIRGAQAVSAARSLSISEKVAKQFGPRGWTRAAIDEAKASGQQVRAINKANGNAATRYVHPQTGQSVVIDDVTGEVIHVGGPGFKYRPASGGLP